MTVIFHSHKILFVCLFVLKDLKEVIVVLKKKKKIHQLQYPYCYFICKNTIGNLPHSFYSIAFEYFFFVHVFLKHSNVIKYNLYHFNNGAITYMVSFVLTWLRDYSTWSFIWKRWGLVIWIETAPLFSIFFPFFILSHKYSDFILVSLNLLQGN